MKLGFGTRRSVRLLVTGAALGSALSTALWASPARAQDSSHDKAVAAFQEGRRHIEQGNCDAAITKLRDSLSYEPSVGARLSLAECIEKTDPLAAWRILRDAANLAYVNHDDRQATAEKLAAALEKRLPTLRVVVPPSTLVEPGFELRIDGELVDRFDYRAGVLATKPGKHVIEASAPQRHFVGQVVTEPGGTTQVDIRLERDTCTAAPVAGAQTGNGAPVTAVAVAENRGSTRRTLGLAIAGVGIAGLASGVVFGIVTLDKKSKIEDLCGGSAGQCNAAPGSVDAERESASTSASISTISFIAGGAALIGGGLLYFTAPNASSPAATDRSPARTSAKVHLAPRASATGATMGLEGTW